MTAANSLPLKWDRRKFQFYLYRRPETPDFDAAVCRHKTYLSALLEIHRAALLILIWQVQNGNQNSPSSSMVLRYMAGIIWTGHHAYLSFCQKRSADIVIFLSGFLDFSNTMTPYWQGKQRKMTEQMNILLLFSAPILSIIACTGYVFGPHWYNPHQPTLVGYWLMSEEVSFYGFIVKAVILLFNQWILWQWYLEGFCVRFLFIFCAQYH